MWSIKISHEGDIYILDLSNLSSTLVPLTLVSKGEKWVLREKMNSLLEREREIERDLRADVWQQLKSLELMEEVIKSGPSQWMDYFEVKFLDLSM